MTSKSTGAHVEREGDAGTAAQTGEPSPNIAPDAVDAFLWALMQEGDLRTLVAMLPGPKHGSR